MCIDLGIESSVVSPARQQPSDVLCGIELSAVGYMIEIDLLLLTDQNVALRLMLADQEESLPIDEATVQWVDGKIAGIEFVRVEPTAHFRLHGFVWGEMVQRAHAIQPEPMAS
jgi:hypothetical protein